MLVPTSYPKVGLWKEDTLKKRTVGRSPIPGLICSYLLVVKKGHQVLCTSCRVQENGCQCRNEKECTWPAEVSHALSVPQGRELEGEGESLVGAIVVVARVSSAGAVLNLIFLLLTYFGFYLDPPKQLIHSMLSDLCFCHKET